MGTYTNIIINKIGFIGKTKIFQGRNKDLLENTKK